MKTLNSVYESHQRISDRYFVVKTDQATGRQKYSWEPHAKEIVVPKFDDYDFFILRKGTEYGIFEGLTGTLVLNVQRNDTMDLRRKDRRAIASSIGKMLEKMGGRASINQGIVNSLMNSKKASPRYESKIKPI